MGTANKSELNQIIALFFMQIFGAVFILFTIFDLPSSSKINSDLQGYMFKAIFSVIGASGVLFALHRDIGPRLWDTLVGPQSTPKFFGYLSLSRVIFFCELINIVVLGVLIYSTGGPRQSFYTPYLLIIVPLTIVIGENPRNICVYFALTAIIFLSTLFFLQNQEFEVLEPLRYNLHYAAITLQCVFFPTAVKLFGLMGRV